MAETQARERVESEDKRHVPAPIPRQCGPWPPTLVVWRLDRFGRSLKDLVSKMETLEEKGADFVSVTEGIDTTTAQGKLPFHLFGALAEFERELNRERTMAGLRAARERGRVGGRPRALGDRANV